VAAAAASAAVTAAAVPAKPAVVGGMDIDICSRDVALELTLLLQVRHSVLVRNPYVNVNVYAKEGAGKRSLLGSRTNVLCWARPERVSNLR
jgi:hypothetical protein